jgi:hypothetical protein
MHFLTFLGVDDLDFRKRGVNLSNDTKFAAHGNFFPAFISTVRYFEGIGYV